MLLPVKDRERKSEMEGWMDGRVGGEMNCGMFFEGQN